MESNEPILQPHHINSKRALKITSCSNCKILTFDKLKLCGECKTVYYCSKECQKADYKIHKNECNQLIGNDKLRHKINEYIKSITINDIPNDKSLNNHLFGYVIQIEDTQKFFESCSKNINTNSLESNNMIYKSFIYDNCVDFVVNYMQIMKGNGIKYNSNILTGVFSKFREKGIMPIVIYCEDLRYTVDHDYQLPNKWL